MRSSKRELPVVYSACAPNSHVQRPQTEEKTSSSESSYTRAEKLGIVHANDSMPRNRERRGNTVIFLELQRRSILRPIRYLGVRGTSPGKIFNLRWPKPHFLKNWHQHIYAKKLSKAFNLRPNWQTCVPGRMRKKTFGPKNTALPTGAGVCQPQDLAHVFALIRGVWAGRHAATVVHQRWVAATDLPKAPV